MQLWPRYCNPNILPVKKCRNVLRHIKSQLHSIIHLPISSDNTFHFYWYLKTHMLIAERKFLLIINVPIQVRAQQLQIWGFQPTSLTRWNISSVLNQWQTHKSHIWWNTSSHDYWATVLNMSSCKWTILQNRCTIPGSRKSTIKYFSRICQEQSRNRSAVFPINISHTICISTHYNHIKPLDSHFNPHHARISCNNDLA